RRAERVERAVLAERESARHAHARVHVGSVTEDIDDYGLLERAMQRTARERVVVERSAAASMGRDTQAASWWQILIAAGAASATFVPLVRPLGDAAVWFACAAAALLIAGVFGARR